MREVQRELERLREAVRAARSMPMSASAVINRQEFLEALDRLETAVATATEDSADLLARRAEFLALAQQEATEVVRQAGLERDKLVSDTEVFRLAQRQAEQLVADAQAEAGTLRGDTETYIEQRFASFEHALERTLGEVRRGIANVTGRNAFDQPAGSHMAGPDDVLLADPDAG